MGCFLMVGAHVAHNCRLADGVVSGEWSHVGGLCGGRGKGIFGWGSSGASVCQDWKVGDGSGSESDRNGSSALLYGCGNKCGLWLESSGDSEVGVWGLREEKRWNGAYEEFFFGGKNRVQALNEIRSGKDSKGKEVKEFCDFIEKTKRGICHGLRAGDLREEEN